ncbi:MAG: flagellin [Paracoccaceae bacterium]
MSSILTNNSAMVALQTLNSINKGMGDVQSQISTGKKIGNAKDNAAVWAISSVMQSDVKGFEAISESLNLGSSTVAVARNATESVNEMLGEIKSRVVAAQEENVDRVKLNNEMMALRDQITSVVGAAQFNGLNLLSNAETTTDYTAAGTVDGSGEVDVLSSLDRSASGVASAEITVGKQDLNQTAAAEGTLTLAAAAMTAAGTADADGATSATYTINGETTTAGRTQAVMAGDTYSFDMTLFDAAVTGTPFGSAAAAKQTAIYTAKDGDTTADIAAGLAEMVNFRLAEQGLSGGEFEVTASNNVMTVTNNTSVAMGASAAGDMNLTAGGTVGGGLAILAELDISTENGAAAALTAVEGLIQTTIDAAASLGTSERRIEIQNDFVGKLTDSLKSGIGSLVDADLEEASARLQALQVQQQLGIQALSIANQAPQNVLSLFR